MKQYRSSGHAFLELVILIPLLLIFSTVAFDLGLYITERGRIDDAIRAALNQTKLTPERGQSDLTRNLIATLTSQLSRSWHGSNSFLSEWQISAVPIKLSIDPASGRISDITINRPASSHAQSGHLANLSPPDERRIRESMIGVSGFEISLFADNHNWHTVSAILLSVRATPRGAHQLIVKNTLGSGFQIRREVIVPIRTDYGQL